VRRNFLYFSNAMIKRIESLDPGHIAQIDGSPSQEINEFQVQIYFSDRHANDLIIKA
jgi:hypothetical protein